MMQKHSLGGLRRFALWVILLTVGAILLNWYLYEIRIARNAEEMRMLSRQADQYERERQWLAQSDDVGKWNEDALQKSRKEVPPTDQLPQFLLELISVEQAAGVTVESIEISTAKLYRSWEVTDSAPEEMPDEAAYGEAGSSGGAYPDLLIQPSLSQGTSSGIYELPLVLKLTGTFRQAVQFLEKLHQLDRTAVISFWRMTGEPEESEKAAAFGDDEETAASVHEKEPRTTEQTFFIELNCSIYFTKQLAAKADPIEKQVNRE
jgi:hypothetical protein